MIEGRVWEKKFRGYVREAAGRVFKKEERGVEALNLVAWMVMTKF